MTEPIKARLLAIISSFLAIIAALIAIFSAGKNKKTVDDPTTEEASSVLCEVESMSIEVRELISESSSFRKEVVSIKEADPATEVGLTTQAEKDEELDAKDEEEAEDPVYDDDEWAQEGANYGSYIGQFELTAYEWTGSPMANGEYPYYGCCASNYFALGTVLYIEGYGTFVVKDRGGSGMANNVIDIYLGDPDACWEFGRKYGVNVYYG